MKHPFDDFLPPSYHTQREDQRVMKMGFVLVAIVSIATAAAFASSLNGWRGLLQNRESVSTRWEDAETRVIAFVRAQKEMKDSVEESAVIEQYIANTPRSLILWEVTQSLPSDSVLHDIRLETRMRVENEDEKVITELLTLLGMASSDASVSAYIDSLSASGRFHNIALMYSQQERDTSKRNFSIQLEVRQQITLAMEEIH
ncbi:MAG: PilN domain-containing protein [Phycisphaerales bacterium]|jgi:Tfp pilus assembly protein PilN|tara:strand:+ start:6091 stop:6693 length:603 start_codon:yes stop_codon:yes gene_type:complete